MGFHTIVYGCILSAPKSNDATREALSSFSFDSVYPFPNIFSLPRKGYQWSTISFATSFKDFEEDIELWLERFEQLLVCIQALSANVHFEYESSGECELVDVRMTVEGALEKPPSDRSWVIFRTFKRGNVTEGKEENRPLRSG
ncbi:MAG: hypothetical protein P4L53_23365 [Candidatus Obscuribacterales bacterium]|nr:hypothetical protein [Candidatus Obscuribacterales bacterium]